MFFFLPQTLSTLVALLGVLYAVSATPPRFQFEKRQDISTGIATTQVSTGVSQNSTSQISTSYSQSAVSTSIKAFSTSNSSTTSTTRIATGVGPNSLSQASTSNEELIFSSSTKALPISNSTGTNDTQITTGVGKNSTCKAGVCHYAIGVGQSGGGVVVALPPADSTALTSSSSSLSTKQSSTSTPSSERSSSSSPSTNNNATATVTSISCQDPTYWAATVSNWKEENVDAKLSSWALNQVPHAPTAIPNGTFPTLLPQIFTGFGDPKLYPDLVGIPGQLMALAIKGNPTGSCELFYGNNGKCPTVQTPQACGNMPRWAYLAWIAIYNMFSLHVQIQGVIMDQGFLQVGQANAVCQKFSVKKQEPEALEILLTVLGSVLTVIGILIPLAGVGEAALLRLTPAEVASAEGAAGKAPTRVGANSGQGSGEGSGQGSRQGSGQGSGDGSGEGSGSNPNMVAPPPDTSPPNINGKNPPGPNGLTVAEPVGAPKTSDPTFIGNGMWVAPGVMTSMSNTIWQESAATEDPTTKLSLNSAAVANYLQNHSLLLTSYSNTLLVNTDNASINNLLSVLAGGSFIETNWSQPIFEIALSADVITRQINTAWHSADVGGVYVSYTQLNDNVNGTICNNTHVGVRSTQVCGDTGVYYLNNIEFGAKWPTQGSPPGFDDLLTFGILPSWPVSSAATAYRILNPNGNVVAPVMSTNNASVFANYMADFAWNNQYDLTSMIGRIPGTWDFPVCDQGGNFWMTDWSKTGGYAPNNVWYSPVPCACGWQGTGTKNFYDAIDADLGNRNWAAGACELLLQYVDPLLPVTEENIGWNKISGGMPPKSIDFGMGVTVPVPTKLPKPCQIGTPGCGAPTAHQPAPGSPGANPGWNIHKV